MIKTYMYTSKQTEIVYEIDCVHCNSCYIGQTKRHLETRIKEHRNDIKKPVNNHSVVTKHRLSQNHYFDWLNPKILYKERHFIGSIYIFFSSNYFFFSVYISVYYIYSVFGNILYCL